MALDNKYDNFSKYKGKIKIRNLDPEVISLINTGGSSGGSGYDDTEIRNDLESIHDTLDSHNNLINNINTKISSAATKTELNQFRRKDVDITYNDLDSDLKERLRNKDSGSGGSSDNDDDILTELEELKSKVTINTGNINNNTSNINSISQALDNYKIESTNKNNEQDATISSNTNRIQQLENKVTENNEITFDDLDPDLAIKIEQIDNFSSDIDSLEQQVSNNTLSISNINLDLSNLTSNFSDLSQNIDSKINNINEVVEQNTNNINDIDNTLNTLTIDKIISFTNTPEDPDKGKIKINNLTSDLADKINNLSSFSTDIEDIKNSIIHPGRNIIGQDNQFVYKNGEDLYTKRIFSFFNTASTEEEFLSLKTQNKSPIYYRVDNNIYEVSGSDWIAIEDGLSNTNYNNIYLFDPKHGSFYFNDNGSLINILSQDDMDKGLSLGNWSFIPGENTFQLKYLDDVFQEWSVSDTNTNTLNDNISLMSLNDNDKNDEYTELIYTINKKDSISIKLSKKQQYICKALILDKKTGLYTDYNYEIFKIYYLSDSIKISNLTDSSITIKIVY